MFLVENVCAWKKEPTETASGIRTPYSRFGALIAVDRTEQSETGKGSECAAAQLHQVTLRHLSVLMTNRNMHSCKRLKSCIPFKLRV